MFWLLSAVVDFVNLSCHVCNERLLRASSLCLLLGYKSEFLPMEPSFHLFKVFFSHLFMTKMLFYVIEECFYNISFGFVVVF